MRAWLAGLCALLGWLGPATAAHAEPPLRIAAASDLRVALPRVLAAFEEGRARGVRVTYGSSGKLHTQIVHGAPYDVFLSADAGLVDDLVRRGLARGGARVAVGEGRLVLWARDDSPVRPAAGLAGLLAVPGARLAIAHPDHAPYGRAAREALRHARAWDGLQGKVVRAENVAQAAQLAATGAVAAALIARPLLQEPGLARGSSWQVPPAWHRPLRQEAVALQRSRGPVAQALIAFLACARGQAICQAAGLAPPALPPGRGMMPGGIR
ncbi:MAG: molybdate ABC transporter substrate-binding protein [Candidatus Sericytochromatia bacterium]|nr:molybdate ABC transporter substrate-binding protein [Candidatus Sericytochromatia bacterium]